MTSRELVESAVKVLDTRKAEDIKVIDIGGISIIADYFLIASGNSTTQVRSLSDELQEKLSLLGVEPRRVEGVQSASWIILDYGDVILHVFYKETRQFFNLERLWADGKTVDISGFLHP